MRGDLCPPCLALLGVVILAPCLHALITDETQAEEFMKELDVMYSHECNLEMLARWEYITDVVDEGKEEAANAAAVRYMAFKGEAAVNSSQYDYGGFTDVELYRRFRFLSRKGPGALDQASLTEYKTLQANMETIYGTATICDYKDLNNCDLTLEPDIEAILASSDDWDELQYTWEQWREATGPLMRNDFLRFVELSNEAARLDGFQDTGYYWLNGYTVDEREGDEFNSEILDQEQFKGMVEAIWEEVSNALYKKLHAYVRMRLQEVYPGKISSTGTIPAHILGNMWAQDWSNIVRHVKPFPEMPSFDITDSMVENGWNIQTMFSAAEDFFQSVGLFPMTQTFWNKSVTNQTAWGKTIVCHASAEDFCLGPEGDDYRIKMCTGVNMVDLVTVHHEMGHIEYFMTYKNQPHVFRDSANAGFHEAIGDMIALSVATPKHLEEVLGLTPFRRTAASAAASSPSAVSDSRYTEDEKRDLNFLMKMALEKIAFLPFGFLIDQYRWGVFDGSISPEELNAGWWRLRESLQGVSPPGGDRGEEFFDPGAKYHVPANVPYIRYFVSFIVQFQFHARLCEAAGHTGPLYTCDIYNNPAAGAILRSAMEKGFSEPWPTVLSELGGTPYMDPRSMIEYFEPLILFLDQELLEAGECIGWGEECMEGGDDRESNEDEMRTEDPGHTDGVSGTTPGEPTDQAESTTDEGVTSSDDAISTTEEAWVTTVEPWNDEKAARVAMATMDANMTQLVQEATLLDWEYNTDVNDDTAEAKDEAWLRVNQVYKEWQKDVIQYYNYQDFESDSLRRQFQLQKNQGTAALDDDDALELSRITSYMTGNYTNRVCPYKGDCGDKGLSIDELEGIMATVKDFDELKYYWTEWREVSGKEMRDDFERSIMLQNRAAIKNGFPDAGVMWLDPYTDEGYSADVFSTEIEGLWNATKPLYQKLHAYVLFILKDHYKDDISDDTNFIPAHVLGNMWAQSWENIYDIVAPHPDVDIPDITEDLETNIEDVKDMFALSENFFTTLGLYDMTADFWNNSMFEDPKDDREVICHASAWDFFDTVNMPEEGRFRIKMCANMNQENFIVIHHEMGHTQYQMSYSVPTEERPLVFRDGANPGIHEAIGDTIALSVRTPKHLEMISNFLNNGSLSDLHEPGFILGMDDVGRARNLTEEETLNFLMKTALEKIPILPFAYLVDKWRWEVFANNNTDVDYNRQWWSKRLDIQGICPPEERFPTSDFDPGSKFHVASNIPYIRYFVAHMLQFSFHRRLCNIAFVGDDAGEIFNCDIYNQAEAGSALKEFLQKGASEPWQDQLAEFLDNDGKMTAGDLIAYFKPLEEYLDLFLKENEIQISWDEGEVDKYMKNEPQYIPPTVPIVVGVVLAVMIVVVMIAYVVGQKQQKKKLQKAKAAAAEQAAEPVASASIELSITAAKD